MNKQEFNIKCVKYMGLDFYEALDCVMAVHEGETQHREYDPYYDMNQLAEVFDKMMSQNNEFMMMKFVTYDCTTEPPTKIDIPIKEAMMDFITTTI